MEQANYSMSSLVVKLTPFLNSPVSSAASMLHFMFPDGFQPLPFPAQDEEPRLEPTLISEEGEPLRPRFPQSKILHVGLF